MHISVVFPSNFTPKTRAANDCIVRKNRIPAGTEYAIKRKVEY
jgi:hypothetical protein